MQFMLGSDPEFFIGTEERVVSVVGLLGGEKGAPLPVIGGGYQEDNMAAEINTDPAREKPEFVSVVQNVMRQVEERLGPYNFVRKATHEFSRAEVMAGGRQARTFGCDPDYNAWTKKVNPNPRPKTMGFRSAAGHVHVGAAVADVTELVKKMDLYLAVPALLMGDDPTRRDLYGMAGSFRPKPYGVEYRVLSNFWCFNPRYIEWVWDNVDRAIHSDVDADPEGSIISDAVNGGDLDAAQYLINRYNLEVINAQF